MSNDIKKIIISLIITCIISSLVGAATYSIDIGFLIGFIFSFLIQLSISITLKTILQSKENIRAVELENKRIAELSKQGAFVECAHCGEDNFIPIRLDVDNEFECTSCNKNNSVYVNITIAQQTEPLDMDSLTVSTYIKERESAIKEILDNE